MYDTREDMPSIRTRPHPFPTIVAAVVTSLITTTGLFFALQKLFPAGAAPSAPIVATPASSDAPQVDAIDVPMDVPNIVGVRTDQAREILDPKGLILSLEDEREDANVPAGAIISQTPLPGSRARRGSEVRAIVSRGTLQPHVPDVTGLSVQQALHKIEQATLVMGVQEQVPSDDAAAGTVVQTRPPAGTAVQAGSTVELVVSQGSMLEVPKVTGIGLSKAKAALAAVGLVVGSTRYEYDDNSGGNVVLRQNPSADSKVPPGTKVDLVVNESD